ncbi:alpha/beta hydrolase [Candidatus Microgenomates bacterium]|nr:alpha/beta hydrolase [Candidatus Microgenomates bacterium]
MAPVAKELSIEFGVLEPLQTKNSVKGQVEELSQQIVKNANSPVVLIGWSWGAWLSFIVTAENPSLVKKLILIGSGPFEAEYAKSIMPTRLTHLTRKEGERVKELMNMFQKGITDNKLFQEFGELMTKADSFDPLQERGEGIEPQSDIYESVWKEAEELRKSGKFLEYGKTIACPVVVIHGDYDPHPFEGIKKPLSKIIKNCKFILLENCGHHPWFEKQAKDKFYEILTREL